MLSLRIDSVSSSSSGVSPSEARSALMDPILIEHPLPRSPSSPPTDSRIAYLPSSPPASPSRSEISSKATSSVPSAPVAPVQSSHSSSPISSSSQPLSTTPVPSLPASLSDVCPSAPAASCGKVSSFQSPVTSPRSAIVDDSPDRRSSRNRRSSFSARPLGSLTDVQSRVPRSRGRVSPSLASTWSRRVFPCIWIDVVDGVFIVNRGSSLTGYDVRNIYY